MAARRVSYRLYFWTKTGKRSTIGRAHSYSLTYGKLKLQSKEKFPSRKKAEREYYLEQVLKAFEKLRQKAIKQRKQKALKKKRQEPLKFEKIKRKKKIGPEETQFDFETYSKDYTKTWTDKVITSKALHGNFAIRILDFDLANPVTITRYDDIEAIALYLEELFYPHMKQFYAQHHNRSMDRYLTRIKYEKTITDRFGDKYTSYQGIGLPREKITSEVNFDRFTDDLFHDWFVNRAERYVVSNYEEEITIYGFTMEVVLRAV